MKNWWNNPYFMTGLSKGGALGVLTGGIMMLLIAPFAHTVFFLVMGLISVVVGGYIVYDLRGLYPPIIPTFLRKRKR